MDIKEAEKGIQIRLSGGKSRLGKDKIPEASRIDEGRRQDHERDFKRQKRKRDIAFGIFAFGSSFYDGLRRKQQKY